MRVVVLLFLFIFFSDHSINIFNKEKTSKIEEKKKENFYYMLNKVDDLFSLCPSWSFINKENKENVFTFIYIYFLKITIEYC